MSDAKERMMAALETLRRPLHGLRPDQIEVICGWAHDEIRRLDGIIAAQPGDTSEAGLQAYADAIVRHQLSRKPTYHTLHVSTATIPRTRLSDLPFGFEVTCTRVGGWTLWRDGKEVAGEHGEPLRLDVAGTVIFDNMPAAAAL